MSRSDATAAHVAPTMTTNRTTRYTAALPPFAPAAEPATGEARAAPVPRDPPAEG